MVILVWKHTFYDFFSTFYSTYWTSLFITCQSKSNSFSFSSFFNTLFWWTYTEKIMQLCRYHKWISIIWIHLCNHCPEKEIEYSQWCKSPTIFPASHFRVFKTVTTMFSLNFINVPVFLLLLLFYFLLTWYCRAFPGNSEPVWILFSPKEIWGSTDAERSLLGAFLIWLKMTTEKWSYHKSHLMGSFMAMCKTEWHSHLHKQIAQSFLAPIIGLETHLYFLKKPIHSSYRRLFCPIPFSN